MITSTQVQLVEWYSLGVEEIEDFQWLLWFKCNEDWNLNIVSYSLNQGLNYIRNLYGVYS